MTVKCKRCIAEGVPKCFVDTASGECAACIAVHAKCSLWVSEKEWERVQSAKRQKRLALLAAEAEVARLRLEIAQAEEEEQAFAAHDTRVADVMEALEREASKSRVASASSVAPPSVPSTDLGWSQADPSLVDPSSFDLSAFLVDFEPLVPGRGCSETGFPAAFAESPSAVPCSS